MSPVFRHGRLRLYLLKLLDEAPRHGYEVIRLLQDRFMGVYAPSPGTIYPRLARLEEDGLVTHEEVDGKKVYSITDKGRAEIRARLGDLADLEDELSESLRDVAREISVDVRDTVRSIREELASAAKEFRFQESARGDRAKADQAKAGGAKADQAKAGGAKADAKSATAGGSSESGAPGSEEAQRIREEARRTRERMRAEFRAQSRSRGDWAGWSAWSEWASGKDWTGGPDWMTGKDRTAGRGFGRDATGTAPGPHGGAAEGAGQKSRRSGGQTPFSDLERIAIQFANELRIAAKTRNLGERSLNNLRDILTDTLAKVRDEVFSDAGKAAEGTDSEASTGRDSAAPGKQARAADHVSQADEAGPDQTGQSN